MSGRFVRLRVIWRRGDLARFLVVSYWGLFLGGCLPLALLVAGLAAAVGAVVGWLPLPLLMGWLRDTWPLLVLGWLWLAALFTSFATLADFGGKLRELTQAGHLSGDGVHHFLPAPVHAGDPERGSAPVLIHGVLLPDRLATLCGWDAPRDLVTRAEAHRVTCPGCLAVLDNVQAPLFDLEAGL